MIVVGKTILSDDLVEQAFVCDLEKCKGACCVQGDAGAPLEDGESEILDREYENFKDFLTDSGRETVAKQGKHVVDFEGDTSTPLAPGGECAYTFFDRDGMAQCGIENAWRAGKTTFRKPISCHLYPIRVDKYDEYDALNYHQWDICSPACALGKVLSVPVYLFLKEPLIRKYGEVWFADLEKELAARDREKPGPINF